MYSNILISLIFIGLCACSSVPRNQQFGSGIERAIGKESYTFFESTEKVSVVAVTRDGKDGYRVISEPKQLTHDEVITLRGYLLKDSGYQFERRKKCVFVPEYAYRFQGKNKEMVVLVSFSCPQIKVLLNQHAVTIDNDPIAAEMEAFTKTIMNK